jgi:hypothetical protein
MHFFTLGFKLKKKKKQKNLAFFNSNLMHKLYVNLIFYHMLENNLKSKRKYDLVDVVT